MEFFYTADDGSEQGPFSERQMTDWIREYKFPEDQKIRFERNGKQFNTTLGRMRKKNGHCTPFIFAKCDRVDKEKALREEIEEGSKSIQAIASKMDELRKDIAKTSLSSRQLMERMQRKIETAANGEMNEENSLAPTAAEPSKAPPHTKSAPIEPSTSKTPTRLLPLFDVSPFNKQEPELGEDREPIKTFRDFLDDVNLEAAQKSLKLPVDDKCRGCGHAAAQGNLRQWLCHITSKNHLEKFRQKGGRVTKQCLDWYISQLEQFPKKIRKEVAVRKEKEKAKEEAVDEGTVDLEKKKLECFMGVIMLPVHVPLLHIDPADTTSLSSIRGREEIAKLRGLIYGNSIDHYGAEKNLHLPRTSCEVCNETFEYAPKLVPHLLSNAHRDKYLAKRGSYSQHDFDFWTAICKLFPEAEKDTRDPKIVRAQLRETGKILDVSNCKDALHYTIYGREDRKRHMVDFMKKQLVEHQRPVVLYVRSEEAGKEMMDYVKEQLPETRIGWARRGEECEELEVIISDSTLRLTRPHAIAFPSAPIEMRQKAEYAQKMCAEYVEANLIIALGNEESKELAHFSKGGSVRLPPPPLSELPVVPTVPPTVTTIPPTVRIEPQMSYAPPPSRVAPPVASVPPFVSQTGSRGVAQGYPTVPPNQRRYDPNPPPVPPPKSPSESKKSNCAIM